MALRASAAHREQDFQQAQAYSRAWLNPVTSKALSCDPTQVAVRLGYTWTIKKGVFSFSKQVFALDYKQNKERRHCFRLDRAGYCPWIAHL
jgi:hypothetical protein